MDHGLGPPFPATCRINVHRNFPAGWAKLLTFAPKADGLMRIANDDSALWKSFKGGDRDSFQALYFNNFKSLYEYGIRVGGDKELVKDCIHDLFVKLWSSKSQLSEVTAVRSYLLVSLKRTIYNKLRQDSRAPVYEVTEQMPFEMVFSVESDYIRKETHSVQTQQLIDALNQLTPRQKEVIYLRYIEGMGFEEIAALMDITVKATYKLTARGLETLRQILDTSTPPLLLLLALSRTELFS
jgi:RNA polymerase sigma factor (sigma-70 family)